MRPFLKWAGSKQRIVERIKAILPQGERLIEPFVGSAAVFLNTEYPTAILADTNADLINVYQQLQREGEPFIQYCQTFFTPEHNDKAVYYTLRRQFNETADSREKAALFLYLNRHGYNGLCRYNLKGVFNVPFGRYKRPYFPQEEMVYFVEKAQTAVFLHADFRTTMQKATAGDVVYCDPPYVPLSQTANFTNYHSSGKFTLEHQQDLATLAEELAERGVPVVVSNHDTEFTREAYQTAVIREFDVRRFISSKPTKRGKVGELLALFTG